MIGWVATSFVIADDRNIEDSELECGEDPVYAAFRWNTCKSMLGIALLISLARKCIVPLTSLLDLSSTVGKS